ncbi:MAG TPA: DUF2961 domain-containing protein [Candidatus Limiplasma sp.]|nr:DUF2961 domain-containing protein [Candidatus Limiplasma sp.]HRX08988.1 DUF2961 domain-containing protein [Candidatus Limiplasma sp.]
MDWRELAAIRPGRRSGMCNGGWAYDAYPKLEKLDAGKTMTAAYIQGPAVITCIHMTQHFVYVPKDEPHPEVWKALGARGIVIEIFFDEADTPAVSAPLGDFFADGCGGRAGYYSTPFVEKVPEAYNCYIPMPFRRSARVTLRNDTDRNLNNYTFVEYEKPEAMPADIGYFHASWKRDAFRLNHDTDRPMFHIDGCGHLIGRVFSICTAEPYFQDFHFIMEGNNEFRIDGEAEPSIDYLGTEDSFGFSWGFRNIVCGLYCGINHVDHGSPNMLSIYRFLDQNAIRFSKSIDLRIDWTHEFRSWTPENYAKFLSAIRQANAAGGAGVDYAMTWYWYQDTPDGAHAPLPPLAKRLLPLWGADAMDSVR